MSREDYFRRKDQLSTTVAALEQQIKVVESYKVLISNKTNGYLSAITSQESPFTHTQFYAKKWFRTFIGIKDEAMLLINGELIRKYHKNVHQSYIHMRDDEQHYYSSNTELLGLSSCCVDGMNYEIRKIEMAYKKLLRGDEGDSINMLGDRVRDVEVRVDSLCKYVDSFAGIFQKELKKRVESVQSATIEVKHKAELLAVKFRENSTTCTDFTFTCQEARKGSRKEALYSAIEEPRNGVSIQQQGDSAAVSVKGSNFRSKMVVVDAADIEYREEAQRQRVEKQDAERRRAEREAARGPDFGFEFSIDREKMHAGAFDLMAVPVDPQKRDAETVVVDEAAPIGQTSPLYSLESGPLTPELGVLRDASIMKVKIVVNNAALSVESAQLHKMKAPGTNVVTFSNTTTGNIVQLYASVTISRPLNFAELKDRASGDCDVPVEEVLMDVCKQLWLGMPFAARGSAFTAYLCLPVSLSVNAKKYSAEELVPLPSSKDLVEKRYLVKIDDRSTTVQFTSSIAKWLSTFNEEDVFTSAKQQFFLLYPLIKRLCDCLQDPFVPFSLSELSHVVPAAIASVQMEAARADAGDQWRVPTLEKLLQLANISNTGRSALQINMSDSINWGHALPTLMTCASKLSAAACGLSGADLVRLVAFVKHHTALPVATDLISARSLSSRSGGVFQSIQCLELQHNRFLSYVEQPWELLLYGEGASSEGVTMPAEEPESEPMDLDAPFGQDLSSGMARDSNVGADPVGQFLLSVLLNSPKLSELDLSYCVESAQQAVVLCRGLVAALKARDTAGLDPLKSVAVRGLSTYYVVEQELRALLQKGGVEEKTMWGVKVLDTSGHSFVI